MSERAANRRIRLLLAVFLVVFFVAIARAVWIQALHGPRIRGDGVAAAPRDDRDSRRPGHDLRPHGRAARDRRADDDRLRRPAARQGSRKPRPSPRGKALGLDPDELYPRLADRSTRFVYVLRKADPLKAAELEKREIPGLRLLRRGAADLSAGRRRGARARLRRRRQQGARGARAVARRDARRPARAARRSSATPSGARSRSSRPGPNGPGGTSRSRSTTRSRPAPRRCWRNSPRHGARRGRRPIVLDVRTGAVLAMANAPAFDANRFAATPAERRRNRAVTDVYEPGSTFKLVTIAAALEDGVVAPTTPFVLPPTDPGRRPRGSTRRTAEGLSG